MFGTITDSSGAVKTNLFGKWSEALYIGKVSVNQSEQREYIALSSDIYLTNHTVAGTVSSLYLETWIPARGSANLLWLFKICN